MDRGPLPRREGGILRCRHRDDRRSHRTPVLNRRNPRGPGELRDAGRGDGRHRGDQHVRPDDTGNSGGDTHHGIPGRSPAREEHDECDEGRDHRRDGEGAWRPGRHRHLPGARKGEQAQQGQRDHRHDRRPATTTDNAGNRGPHRDHERTDEDDERTCQGVRRSSGAHARGDGATPHPEGGRKRQRRGHGGSREGDQHPDDDPCPWPHRPIVAPWSRARATSSVTP